MKLRTIKVRPPDAKFSQVVFDLLAEEVRAWNDYVRFSEEQKTACDRLLLAQENGGDPGALRLEWERVCDNADDAFRRYREYSSAALRQIELEEEMGAEKDG